MRTRDPCLYFLSVLLFYKPESNLGYDINITIGNGRYDRPIKAFLLSKKRVYKPIIGGEYVKSITQFPFMAFVEYKKGSRDFTCGATILSTKYLMTAGHCVADCTDDDFKCKKEEDVKPYKIHLGSVDALHPLVTAKVKQIFVHPKFRFFNEIDDTEMFCDFPYDMGIMKLKTRLVFSDRISHVRLTTPDLLETRQMSTLKCTVVGWGVTKELKEHQKHNTRLKFAKVNLISFDECENHLGLGNNENICRSFHICTIDYKFENSFCLGDSGGPLICNGMQVGIASRMTNGTCLHHKAPNIFTRVNITLQWIKKIMSRDEVRELESYY